jgi:nucleosome binding factor SPN SPT16 subunit
MRIDAIPATNLDSVREWLGSMEIKYFENKVNLNWYPLSSSHDVDRLLVKLLVEKVL